MTKGRVVPEHEKTPEARLWAIREVIRPIHELRDIERTRPWEPEEKELHKTLCHKLRGYRAMAKAEIFRKGDQQDALWVKILVGWNAKNTSVPTLKKAGLENVVKPQYLVAAEAAEAARAAQAQGTAVAAGTAQAVSTQTVTQKALTPTFNKDLYRESQRRFGKLKHPVLELMALGYNRTEDGVEVPPQARVNALKEAAKYFEPQLKQIEIRQTHGDNRTGVLQVPGMMDPEGWSKMVSEHMAVINKATKKLNEVASGRDPTTIDGEIEEVEAEEVRPTGREQEQEQTQGEKGATVTELPAKVVRLPPKPGVTDTPPDPEAGVNKPQWEIPPPELTKPPKDYDKAGSPRADGKGGRSYSPPRRPIGRTRKLRDPDAED